jgi:chromosome segregation ATPase
MNISKELNEKILKVENENKKIWDENQTLKNDLEELTKQVYQEKDRLKDLELEHKSLQEEKISLDDELASR